MTDGVFTVPFSSFDSDSKDVALGFVVDYRKDRPPEGMVFIIGPAYDGTCFGIKNNRLYFSRPKQPEVWPESFFIEIDSVEISGVTAEFHNGALHYFTCKEIWQIQGTGQGLFQPFSMRAKTGSQSLRGAVSVHGRGIFHTGPDGIYLFSGSDRKITEDTLEPVFRGDTIGELPGVSDMSTSWLWHFQNHLYFGYASSGFTYPHNIISMNLDSGRLNHYSYNDGSDIQIRTIQTDETNKRLLIGDATGFIRQIEKRDATDDSGTAILYVLESKEFTLQTRRHFPRWVKYDIDASSATSCTGALLLDGAIHHSHTISGNRVTRRRLVGEGNGRRAANRISGSGVVTIHAVESE